MPLTTYKILNTSLLNRLLLTTLNWWSQSKMSKASKTVPLFLPEAPTEGCLPLGWGWSTPTGSKELLQPVPQSCLLKDTSTPRLSTTSWLTTSQKQAHHVPLWWKPDSNFLMSSLQSQNLIKKFLTSLVSAKYQQMLTTFIICPTLSTVLWPVWPWLTTLIQQAS